MDRPNGCSQKKTKKDKNEIVISLEDLSPIAHPLAEKKLTKKLYKAIRRGMEMHSATVARMVLLIVRQPRGHVK